MSETEPREPTGICGEQCLEWKISGDYACEQCPVLKDLERDLIGDPEEEQDEYATLP